LAELTKKNLPALGGVVPFVWSDLMFPPWDWN